MKKILFALLLAPVVTFSQEYVDVFKIGYGQTFRNEFEGSDNTTNVITFESDLTLPLRLSDNQAVILGAAFSKNNLQLIPGTASKDLQSVTLKLGYSGNISSRWSSTLLFLPKIASDFTAVQGDDVYFGGLAIFKYHKSRFLKYRFGLYASTEAFGVFSTPIIGLYYRSPNTQFEMDLSLPISADINYTFNWLTLGVDYFGIGRSFRLYDESEVSTTYVDLSSLEFASYLQVNLFDKSVLLRSKLGYASSEFEVYPNDQTIDLGLSALSIGDDRTQLNPDISGGFFFRFEALYRFDLSSDGEEIDVPIIE